MNKFINRVRQFSLVELCVVIAIVGILAALVIPGFVPTARAQQSANPFVQMPAKTNINSVAWVSTNSTLITSNDTLCVGALFSNPGTNDVYLAIGEPAVLKKGIYLKAGAIVPLPYPTTSPIFGISTLTASNPVPFSLGAR